MKKVLFLLFILTKSFSQIDDHRLYTVAEIDSLSNLDSCKEMYDLGGSGVATMKRFENGKEFERVGFSTTSIKPHFYFIDKEHYSTLTKNQKNLYDDSKTCILVRADYTDKSDFEDGSYVYKDVKFYYNDKTLFYVKYEIDYRYGSERGSEISWLFWNKMENRIDDIGLKNWLSYVNDIIIEKCVN